MGYQIESKPANKKSWFTPAEARNYYGRYSRDKIAIHWWGGGEPASKHDSIVNYFLSQGNLGKKSVNYVLSDNKITKMVEPDDVSWTTQSANAYSIAIEHQPTLGAEGYKKSGWLVWQLRQRYGRYLPLIRHSSVWQTQCPGTISLDRIEQEANKWARGEYDPAPVPTPTPPANAKLRWETIPRADYQCNKQPTTLWNFDTTSWSGFKPVKTFNQGEKITIYGRAINETLGATYLVTEYSYNKKIPNGFNQVDLTLVNQPTPPEPTPPPTPEPTPIPVPEWVTNLQDIDDTRYWVTEDIELIDITTGNPTGTKTFKKDEEFVASALTVARGTEYRITDYSFKKGIFNGVPTDKLTLTAPGEPNVPPVEQPPAEEPPDKNAIIAFLEMLIKLISEFVAKLKG